MPIDVRENVLRRLLVSKHFLASSVGQLTSNSDPIVVAKMILSAHDTADLTLAAIVEQLRVPDLSSWIYLLDYPYKIEEHIRPKDIFPGTGFWRQLNTARNDFKHEGILPDTRTWYRVIENTWEWVDTWCQTYLEISLNEIDLDELLANVPVKALYREANSLYLQGRYRATLESLSMALYQVLEAFPSIRFPVFGRGNTHDALMLATFGVRPSDFLSLQAFLPSVSKAMESGKLVVEWKLRETGHPGNWSQRNVRFCLEAFIDIVLKVQHAP